MFESSMPLIHSASSLAFIRLAFIRITTTKTGDKIRMRGDSGLGYRIEILVTEDENTKERGNTREEQG